MRVRQGKVNSHYRVKAKLIDVKYNGHQDANRPGPVELKFTSFGRVRGLVCGAFGEGSPDLHTLCAKLTEVAAATRFRDLAATNTKAAKARAARFVYRAIGIEMLKGTAALKSYRMGVILAGTANAKAAAARRKWAKSRWEQEQETYFYSHNYGNMVHCRPW